LNVGAHRHQSSNVATRIGGRVAFVHIACDNLLARADVAHCMLSSDFDLPIFVLFERVLTRVHRTTMRYSGVAARISGAPHDL
jgi:hypothetical protein